MKEQRKVGTVKWDERFYRLALEAESWSKDPDRKVGAAVVSTDGLRISLGYNGFPRGVMDLQKRLDSNEEKLSRMVHAERNALRNAPFDVRHAAIYCTKFPCEVCAAEIIQYGLSFVISPRPDFHHPTWGKKFGLAVEMLTEAGILTYCLTMGEPTT